VADADTTGAGPPSPATPPARSPFATLSLWCGIAACIVMLLIPLLLSVSFLLLFPLTIIAILSGVIALYQIRQTPQAWRGTHRAIAGMIMGGGWLLFLLVFAIAVATR
jgi:hypothetical protein